MPLQPLPLTIELTDWSAGWMPKPGDPGVPVNAVLDSMNLVLDRGTGTVKTRQGIKALFALAGVDGYGIYALHPYRRTDGAEYLIAVLSRNTQIGNNNVKVVAVDLAAGTLSTISPTKTWNGTNGRHWGAVIDGAYYGGGESDEMYRWFPGIVDRGAWAAALVYKRGDKVTSGGVTYTALREHRSGDGTGDTHDNRPGLATHKSRSTWTTEWHDSVGTPGAFPAWDPTTYDEDDYRPRNYAFKRGDTVSYTYNARGDSYTKNYESLKDIRFDKWDTEKKIYKRGDRVSLKVSGYWQSYEASERHVPDNGNKPGEAASKWSRVRLEPPLDDDGELNAKHWREVPYAPKTRVAAWFGNRLLARHDENHQILIYSRQSKVGEKDNRGRAVVGGAGDPQWDADDWRTGGEGGPAGFQPFETRAGDDIQAIVPFGHYCFVFKRYTTHSIAGRDPETWQIRELDEVGVIGELAATEHDGLMYFISDRGFYVSEGTTIKPVPGSEKIEDYIRQALDHDAVAKDVRLFSFGGYVWICLPTDRSGVPAMTILYEPMTQSFWPVDLAIQAATTARLDGLDRLFFAPPTDTGTTATAVYAWTNPGAAPQSSSTRVLDAVTVTNLVKNPNFENAPSHMTRPVDFNYTTEAKTKFKTSKAAGRRKLGVQVSNLRKEDSVDGPYSGWEGFYQDITVLSNGDHNASIYVRRAQWEKHPKKKPDLKIFFRSTGGTIQIINLVDANYTYAGDGWFRVNRTVTGGTGVAREVGWLIPPAADYHFDQMMVVAGSAPTAYFDGDGGGGDDYSYDGGDTPQLLVYDHPDAGDTDDGDAIRWYLETSWLTFGALQEERRIRRLWALIEGADVEVALRTFSNFRAAEDGQSTTTVTADSPINYHEGVLPEDCHAILVAVEGDSAPASVLGVAIDTELRRIRFGRR